ncbi:MAG: hypothetical protein KAT93_07985, partial [Desulfuromonadales bacterium]|nr:hypothetical protein [Desulfuromonadales bacterium]
VLAGAEVRFLNNKLALRADHEQSIGNHDENSDFPTRTLFGADYRLSDKINLFVEQEYTWGDKQDTEGTRAGFSTQPWNGGSFDTSIEQQMTENGRRVFALFGLQQNWQVTEHWSLDTSLDRNQTIKHPGNDSFDTDAAPATGSEDFTSVSLGGTARFDNWSWTNRIEARAAETEDRWGLTTSVVTEPEPGVAFSSKAQVFLTDRETGQESLDGDIRFGLAYRPAASHWILLNRLDFYFEREDGSGTDYDSWRLINNLNANYKPNRRFQIALQYGLKYVQENFDGQSYDGFTDLIGTEARYNITSKLDVGLHGSLLHSWNSGQFDYSVGASIGYAVMENTWVSLGYNLVGFEDEDFSAAQYTAQGVFLRFRVKFDQQSVKDAVEWLNR